MNDLETAMKAISDARNLFVETAKLIVPKDSFEAFKWFSMGYAASTQKISELEEEIVRLKDEVERLQDFIEEQRNGVYP